MTIPKYYQKNKDIINPLLLGTLVLLIFIISVSYLLYSLKQGVNEYNKMLTAVEEDGYIFATEIYRLPAKDIVNRLCDTSDLVFLYKNEVYSYSEIQEIKDIYTKKDLFCKS